MGRECHTFYLRLSNLLSEKRDLLKIDNHGTGYEQKYALPVKISLLCLRGSRTVCRKVAEFESDIVSEFISRI